MTDLRRVQAYDGEGDLVLDVAVLDQVNADWLVDFLEDTTDGFDFYNDPLPSADPRSGEVRLTP